ncbi:MAG: GmrSD restriction endonuclease domain-containing protein [Acidobacteriaceae bacterium]
MEPTLDQLEKQSLEEDDAPQVPPADIVAYNELRSCADLFRMHEQGILQIQPEFQRDVVWKGPDQTRFIDSLVKQLPIPSMCFALDHKAQRWIVIDGLQRISTIIRFLQGGDWNLSSLEDIEPEIAGKSVAAIKTKSSPLHQYYTRVENLSVPVTVLRCNFSKKAHMEYLFTIFHRLNTGGIKLNNQEIRNCIYGGAFNELLKESDKYTPWRKLNKMRTNQLFRFTKQEIILRFLAFEERFEKYEGHLAKFLNTYMHDYQNASADVITEKSDLFRNTVECIMSKIFPESVPPKLSLTVTEALLVGVGRNIQTLKGAPAAVVSKKFDALLEHQEFSEAALKEGLSKRLRVIARLNTAVDIFSGN